MTPYACFLLLSGILSGLFIKNSESVPTFYDQRQDGDFNVHAKFSNFLFVFAPPSTDLQSFLTTQTLEIADLTIPILTGKQALKETPESVVYETDDGNLGKEPYRVEIIHIDKEKENPGIEQKPEIVKIPAKEIKSDLISTNVEKSEKLAEKEKIVDTLIDEKKDDKKGRSLWRTSKNTDKGTPAKVQSLKSENEPQEDFTVKEDALKPAKPGISLKKQLSRKHEENEAEISGEKNEVETKPQELKLLGGGIENCGPGRYRDAAGVCQDDKNFH